MLKAWHLKRAIIRLDKERRDKIASLDNHTGCHSSYLINCNRIESEYLTAKAKLFKKPPTLGSWLFFTMWRFNQWWWARKLKKALNYIHYKTPYQMKFDQWVTHNAPQSLQDKMAYLHAKNEAASASLMEAAKRHGFT